MQFHYSNTGARSKLSIPIESQYPQVSESSFSFLFSEFISYQKRRVSSSTDLEQKIDQCGFDIGFKILEILYSKLKPGKRPTKLMEVLQFISSSCWKYLFGRNVDALERGADNPNEYMLTDNHPLCSKYISVPKELGEFSCCSFVGGIIRGIMVAAGFPCTVTAYDMKEEGRDVYSIYLIRLNV
ncbi:hypothetical protein JH06_2777 [Blastocystis sp. subtype 4]|uniref:hypothetical protein n=1 Tax=Blastocystis sp. subtype 4 TaxID=944170 RepID=UPI000711FE2C|nr:hypothetical protein JH06_2777 [Blastocystis sp. subtype 4]KNB43334.1 hypothetical protein JH06_2777 [Blastocystis sp. subtype 4]|eukprot:XP_014526777.1 hypothetical protein JH06_2777 [Blastocystis sp. subtype 4]